MTVRFFVFLFLAVAMATSASAQVTYRFDDGGFRDSSRARSYGDEDLSYATHPSFQIFETPGGAGVRVIERCAYPNGWNATDFIRDVNGTPPGYDHTCPATFEAGRHGRTRY